MKVAKILILVLLSMVLIASILCYKDDGKDKIRAKGNVEKGLSDIDTEKYKKMVELVDKFNNKMDLINVERKLLYKLVSKKDVLKNVNNGRLVSVKQQQNSVVLIEIWATYCKPCLKDMSKIVKLWQRNKKHKIFKLYSITLDESCKLAMQTKKRQNLPYDIYKIEQEEFMGLNKKDIIVPYYILIYNDFVIQTIAGVLSDEVYGSIEKNIDTLVHNNHVITSEDELKKCLEKKYKKKKKTKKQEVKAETKPVVEQPVVEETPAVEEAPVEEAPAEEVKAEEPKVEEAPVEEASAEEKKEEEKAE